LQLGTLQRHGYPGLQWDFSIVVSKRTLHVVVTICDDPDESVESEDCSDSDESLQYDESSDEPEGAIEKTLFRAGLQF